MKKIIATAIVVLMAAALCTTAFAASHAPEYKVGDTLVDEKFDGEDLGEAFAGWAGYKLEDGKIHLGYSGNWIESSPEFHTVAAYSNYYASFKIAGAPRDCYYGFALRAPEGEHGGLMNGGRFGVPSPDEMSTGLAIDLYGAANSTLGDKIGITFCNGARNGDAPAFMVDRPEGFGDGGEALVEVVDTGDVITIMINGKEIVTIELSEQVDGAYTKAAAYKADGSEIGKFDVSVLAAGSIVFYQRNDYITVDDLKIAALTEGDEEQQGGGNGN